MVFSEKRESGRRYARCFYMIEVRVMTLFKPAILPKTCKVYIRPPGKGNSNSHGARPVYQNHLDDQVDSDQKVVYEEVCLCETLMVPARMWP